MICPHNHHSTKILFVFMQSIWICIARDFEPASWRKNSARKHAKNSEFVWKNGGKSVGRASRVPPSGFEKAVEFCIGVFIKPYQNLFSKQKLIAHPCAEAPLCEAQSFSKGKGRNVRIQNGLGFAKTIFWERIRKTETNVFEIRRGFWISSARRKGLGGNPRGLPFGFFWRAMEKKYRKC